MLADPKHQNSLREMPSFRSMAFQLVRGRPTRLAALPATPIRLAEHTHDMFPLHFRERVTGSFQCAGPCLSQRSVGPAKG
jgi:hypothetical protein